MSILIKGMEMPKNCNECALETDYGACGYYDLYVTGGKDSDWRKRRDDCPLIELPPHGRLIDADALMENAQYKGTHDIVTAWDIVGAPTIIPAEEEICTKN